MHQDLMISSPSFSIRGTAQLSTTQLVYTATATQVA